MVQAGAGAGAGAFIETPRTNLGDATYLTNQQFDFDISQEKSFQSPSKDNNNLLEQLHNGRRGAIRTPRSRVILSDRRNLPGGIGSGEFTPLLKSATRNSALRSGKENVPQTPAFLRSGGLDRIPEDFSPLPVGSSVYGEDTRSGSYMAGTPMPEIDSSEASTPMALLPRRKEGPGILQDGNQLSLREQENVIDKIEKENFGLKLKIHFLEEALRKAGPGFSEAALKENTELKVDKVTMQRELHRYRKTLTTAERDVELYRQQILEMQEKIKRKHVNEGQREELDQLRKALNDKEEEISRMRSEHDKYANLEDKIHDLEADLREKDRVADDKEDEVDNLKDNIERQAVTISNLEEELRRAQRRAVELEEKAQSSEELADAKTTIEELERDLERLTNQVGEMNEDHQDAIKEKERAEADLQELQEELANKSISTKGLNRQIEEKASRLQDVVENLKEQHGRLEQQYIEKSREVEKLQDKFEDLSRDSEVREQKLQDKFDIVNNEKEHAMKERGSLLNKLHSLQNDLNQKNEEKSILQIRHDALTSESAGLQRELAKSRQTIEDLEYKLDHEKTLALANEREVRDQYKGEIDRLNDEIEDIRAEMREKERLYDEDSDKWDSEKRTLESRKDRAEEHAANLQSTINKMQEAKGDLSGKETKLQQALQSERDRHESQKALLARQIKELNEDVKSRRKALEEANSALSGVREELRLSQREQKSLAEKVEGLEDEIEILQTSLDDESDRANEDITAIRQESESLRKQLSALKQDVAKAESTSAIAKAEVHALQGKFQTDNGSKEQLTNMLRDHESQLSKVRQDKQSLQDQLAKTNIELHSIKSSNAELKAERDEIQSQLRSMKQQEEETFRLDQERVDLRTAKMKLDNEVRRLREENKAAVAQQQVIEKELQHEIDRAGSEEARLSSEIQDLQRILRGSSEKRELAIAKKTIQNLEERVHELESQIASGNNHADATTNELSMVQRELSTVRQKEAEYVQREAAQKDVLRSLKRQIADLERKAHEAEISRIAVSSPQSSVSGSARKSELIEVRNQLAKAHQSLKDLRAKLKDVERDSARKLTAAAVDAQAKYAAWESEKDALERSLDEIRFSSDELLAEKAAAEATITRLRGKIDRLEKALQAERNNSGEDRTMALERRDLHEMLRETQIQAETLEVVVKEQEETIAAIAAAELQLRSNLKRVRDDRALQRSKLASANTELENLERKFLKAKDEWEAEKKSLCRGVRFANMSLSMNDEEEILTLKKEAEEREKRHVKEIRGLMMSLDWLKARCKREENLRADAAFAKRYMALQIKLYDAWYDPPRHGL